MAKIIKNTTALAVTISDTGQVVPLSSQLTISAQDYDLYAASEDIILLIADGTLVVNDGSFDLTPAQGIGLIQGSFIQRDFVDNLKTNNRLKVDVTGTLSDGTVKVTSSDQLAEPLNNKIASADSKLAISVINAGATEALLFTVQSANINTADLNNNANFITSAGAPVQPADIADFETTTELNVRDTNNRNRANHTGTQTASTISDFTTAVQAAETTTSLSFDNGTKILSYVNEDGSTTNVDLNQFLDDTNLAQIVSGSLNATTGIVTFTRDDASTFTVDFSPLNDQAAITTAINAHETTLGNHDDVDLTTDAPASGNVLTYNGTNWVPVAPSSSTFKDYVSTSAGVINQATTYSPYLTLSTTVPSTGLYKISWSYTWSLNDGNNNFQARVQIDNTTTIMEHDQEPGDSAGTGVSLPLVGGGPSTDSGTDQRHLAAGFDIVNLTSGAHTIELDYKCQVVNQEAAIYRGILSIEEW